jgi:hypothetical protein
MLTVLAVAITQTKLIGTTCNLRFNNRGIIYGNIPCQAQFKNRKLNHVTFAYPKNKTIYRWTVGQPGITADRRWDECIRHTAADGNQWQVCTVPFFDQLKHAL